MFLTLISDITVVRYLSDDNRCSIRRQRVYPNFELLYENRRKVAQKLG